MKNKTAILVALLMSGCVYGGEGDARPRGATAGRIASGYANQARIDDYEGGDGDAADEAGREPADIEPDASSTPDAALDADIEIVDASADGAEDAAIDAPSSASDAETDSGTPDSAAPVDSSIPVDAALPPVDSGPACVCTSGPCCDGCNLRGTDHICEYRVDWDTACNKDRCGTYWTNTRQDRHCDGKRPDCAGRYVWKYDSTRNCAAGKWCGELWASTFCFERSDCYY